MTIKNSKKTISILGCGWLGTPLAEHLIKIGYQIKGSTTTADKLENLKSKGIRPYNLVLKPDSIEGDIDGFLEASEVVVINIPPNLKNSTGEKYLQKLVRLHCELLRSKIVKVIFISSTSVYRDYEDFRAVEEDPQHYAHSNKAQFLLKAEDLFAHSTNFKTTIVRFSGLIGKERHPAFYLSGKTKVKNPKAPVNLIHLDDCVEIIATLIKNNIYSETFNASSPGNPTREYYYQKECTIRGLLVPNFEDKLPEVGKLVSSEKLIAHIDYSFIHRIE